MSLHDAIGDCFVYYGDTTEFSRFVAKLAMFTYDILCFFFSFSSIYRPYKKAKIQANLYKLFASFVNQCPTTMGMCLHMCDLWHYDFCHILNLITINYTNFHNQFMYTLPDCRITLRIL